MIFKIRHEKRGIHIWCRLFAAKAPNMTYAGCGEFCVREEEFEDLQRVMSGIFFEEVEDAPCDLTQAEVLLAADSFEPKRGTGR